MTFFMVEARVRGLGRTTTSSQALYQVEPAPLYLKNAADAASDSREQDHCHGFQGIVEGTFRHAVVPYP
jgi:hypothetical protein